MLVEVDIEAIQVVGRTVLVEAEQLTGVANARAAVAMPGAATGAALARAGTRLSSAVEKLGTGVAATARSVGASAAGYDAVDAANAFRLGGVSRGGV